MKSMKKIVALVIAMMLVSAMAYSAFAVSITITRDSSYDGNTDGSGTGNTYTYYQMFEAVFSSGTTATNANGHTSGTPNTASGTTRGVSYTTTTDVKEAIEASAAGNYFTFTAIAGDSGHWNVSWNTEKAQTSDNIIAAANALKSVAENGTYLKTGTLESTNTGWQATNIPAGYYVISSAAGNNVIAATTDITINEKNTYPSIDKKQNDPEDGSGTYGDDSVNVAVGDVINYKVEVTVPSTVKVGDTILVWDKATEGLTYKGDVASDYDSNAAVTITNSATVTDAAWEKVIKINDLSVQGKVITFTFSMTVDSDAIVDTGRKNESSLKYGHSGTYDYESIPDEVEYKTYFAGIHKIDGDTKEDLEGVKFTLKENDTVFMVVQSGTYYYPSSGTGASGTVVTNSNGQIIIRGLDKDKTYTLTEIETLPGYNMLTEDVPLTTVEDTGSAVSTDKNNSGTWGQVENNKGTVLPSTGGMGTTIIYIVGALLVIGAGVLLVSKRRAN